MSIRRNDCIEVLNVNIVWAKAFGHHLPYPVFVVTLGPDINDLTIVFYEVFNLLGVILQVFHYVFSRSKQLCSFREGDIRKLHEHMRQITFQSFVHWGVKVWQISRRDIYSLVR